ncbi:MAG: ABC transporter permease [Deltaproteobacteria bacterium]|nr:ABC transporter permease [Deltaproteobacteria bacterium]
MRCASSSISGRRAAVVGAPLLYLLLFFAAPTALMVVAAFRVGDEFGGLAPLWAGGRLQLTGEAYGRFLSDPIYLEVFLRSAGYAAATTAACLVLAFPLALAIVRSPARRRSLLVLLVILPFWSNFLVRVYAWMMLLSPEGFLLRGLNAGLAAVGLPPLQLLFTPAAVIVCLVYVNLPFMVLPLYANLERHDPALLEAARDLGAGPLRAFRTVTLPLCRPGILAGAALVGIPALGAFAVPDLVGGTRSTMLGSVISQQFLAARDWPFGSVLAVVLTLAAIALAALVRRAVRSGERRG